MWNGRDKNWNDVAGVRLLDEIIPLGVPGVPTENKHLVIMKDVHFINDYIDNYLQISTMAS